MNTRHFATTRQTAVAGLIPRRIKRITPNPPLRHGNQQGSISAKAASLLRLFSDDLDARYGERTAPEYLSHVRVFLEWLEARGVELAEMRPADLSAYQADLVTQRKRGGAPYSIGHQVNRLKAVRCFCRLLYRRHLLLSDPSAGLEFPRVDDRLPRVILTMKEAQRIVEAPQGRSPLELRDRAILETLYGTGIRAAELKHLTPYDVDTEQRLLRVIKGKGRKDRVVPLTRAAADAIEAYLLQGRPALLRGRSSGALFPGERSAWLRGCSLWLIVRGWAKRAGISKKISAHTFRHSMATHLLKNRADIRQIQVLLGHRSLRSTERYTRVEMSDLEAVIRRAHPRGR